MPLRRSSILALAVLLQPAPGQDPAPAPRPNVLLITVDDMSCDSVGAFGCKLEGITPHIDALAASGIRFRRAHVTIAICQPTRAVWMTGRYPHNSGALGFDPIDPQVPTLVEALHHAGYYTGLLGKQRHVVPTRKAAFDVVVGSGELGQGRSAARYGQEAAAFFAAARRAEKPFFLMANAHDPHRPFAGSAQESKRNERQREKTGKTLFRDAPRTFDPAIVPVPGFLPDIPPVRREIAEYFASVHRADATVGALLDALDKAGGEAAASTLVMFLSDHGMPLPFAKANCYHHSTHTPWIVRWPGVTKRDTSDDRHFVSGIDLAPTVLEAVGLPPLEGTDGRSFVPLLRGASQDGRDDVFTMINTLSSKRSYPMRSVRGARYGYIFNAWSDGETAFKNEAQNGLTFRAMKKAAQNDAAIAARVDHFVHRVPEELYDYRADSDARHNLASDPARREQIDELRARMLTLMEQTRDPLHPRYRRFLGR